MNYRLNDDIVVPNLGVPILKFFHVEDYGRNKALVFRFSYAQFDNFCLQALWRDLKSLAHVTCSYYWEHPPDEMLIGSRPTGDGVLQLSLDTPTATLSQENAATILRRLGQLIPLLSRCPEG